MAENELSQEDVDTLFEKSGGPTGESATAVSTAKEAASSAGVTPAGESPAAWAAATSVTAPPKRKEQVDAHPVEFAQLGAGQSSQGEARKIDFLLDVPVTVTVELGRTSMVIRDALNLGGGSVVELNKLAGEPVDVLINNKLVARAEVVVVNENFGVKVIDIVSPEERLRYLR
ncbi:MAG: flagellar motor switch protein FliN [Verrucomicrobia bacterium]|nr:flagellar motor switch protein FliN [Verrucomicrobiota bacterium]